MRGAEVLVVGAGLAGSAAAIHLARAGRAVTLLEKATQAHDKVCGEFLSAVAQRHLADLGVDLDALGAVTIDRLRLSLGHRSVEVPLHANGRSLSRKRLDDALLAQARKAGAQVETGRKVGSLRRLGHAWQAETEAGAVSAEALFLATGKTDLRGLPRPATGLSDIVAFKQHFRLSPEQTMRMHGYVELILFEGGYAGLELVEEGKANLCLVISKAAFRAAGKDWPALFDSLLAANSVLAERMRGATALWERPLAVAGVPYGFLHQDGAEPPLGLYRLGDQMAVIPSFCGDGMSMALSTAAWAAESYRHGDAASYHRQARKRLGPTIRRAATLSRLIAHPMPRAALFLACRAAPSLLGYADRLLHLPQGRG